MFPGVACFHWRHLLRDDLPRVGSLPSQRPGVLCATPIAHLPVAAVPWAKEECLKVKIQWFYLNALRHSSFLLLTNHLEFLQIRAQYHLPVAVVP